MRLTKDHRNAICQRILTHKYTERIQQNDDAMAEWSQDAYIDYLGKDRELVENSSERLWRFSSHIGLYVGHNYVYLFLKTSKRILGTDKAHQIPEGSKLAKRYYEIKYEHDDIREERRKDRNDIMAVLASVTTKKRLLEVWPEIETIVNEVLPETANQSTALAIVDENLNKRLGLPPGSETPKPAPKKKTRRKTTKK